MWKAFSVKPFAITQAQNMAFNSVKVHIEADGNAAPVVRAIFCGAGLTGPRSVNQTRRGEQAQAYPLRRGRRCVLRVQGA